MVSLIKLICVCENSLGFWKHLLSDKQSVLAFTGSIHTAVCELTELFHVLPGIKITWYKFTCFASLFYYFTTPIIFSFQFNPHTLLTGTDIFCTYCTTARHCQILPIFSHRLMDPVAVQLFSGYSLPYPSLRKVQGNTFLYLNQGSSVSPTCSHHENWNCFALKLVFRSELKQSSWYLQCGTRWSLSVHSFSPFLLPLDLNNYRFIN